MSLSGDRRVLAHLGEKPWSGVESGVGGEQEVPVVLPGSPKDSILGEIFASWVFPFVFKRVVLCLGKTPRKSRSPTTTLP